MLLDPTGHELSCCPPGLISVLCRAKTVCACMRHFRSTITLTHTLRSEVRESRIIMKGCDPCPHQHHHTNALRMRLLLLIHREKHSTPIRQPLRKKTLQASIVFVLRLSLDSPAQATSRIERFLRSIQKANCDTSLPHCNWSE